MEGYIIMSNKELDRLEVLQKVLEKRLKQRDAASQLNLSIRQIKRLSKKLRDKGAQGIVSLKRGKPSNRKTSKQLKDSILDLISSKYSDFGPTLAHEKLREIHNFTISISTVRTIMVENGIWTPKKIKKRRVFQHRERRPCYGELIQVDGSDHAWFEDRGVRCTLLVFIDDATNEVYLRFARSENTWDYMEAFDGYLKANGRPLALYTDKHGVFRVNHKNSHAKNSLTQFGRAAKDLEIAIICANTPQAKGRVERVNKTLQDRLVKELRLRNISTIEEANLYLPLFMKDFNRRFSKPAKSSINAHRGIDGYDLTRIFTLKETRHLSKNLTLQYKNTIYQVKTSRPSYALRKASVTVLEYRSGKIEIEYKEQKLNFSAYHEQESQGKEVLSKLLNEEIDCLPKKKWKPSHNHPWKQYRPKAFSQCS
jgi:Trp operon repressor